MPKVLYVLPTSAVHGGIRVILDHAEGLAGRGWNVGVVGPDPSPTWHPSSAVPYVQAPLDRPDLWPPAEVVIATFWTTIEPAVATGAAKVLHFCQGYEGVHREYASVLPRIRAVYRHPIPKLLVSVHLERVLAREYGAAFRTHLLGQFIDSELFSPGDGESVEPFSGLKVGLVGPGSVRSKGIDVALRGLALARAAGTGLEVHRAAAEPMTEAERQIGVTDVYRERLDTNEMVGFYRSLDLLLFSSYDEEGYPLPPLEAMACGVPVALTRISPFEVVPEGASAWWTPGRAEEVPELLAGLGEARRAQLAATGRDYALSLTLGAVLDRLEVALRAEGVEGP